MIIPACAVLYMVITQTVVKTMAIVMLPSICSISLGRPTWYPSETRQASNAEGQVKVKSKSKLRRLDSCRVGGETLKLKGDPCLILVEV